MGDMAEYYDGREDDGAAEHLFNAQVEKMIKRYEDAKRALKGATVDCPSCGRKFAKKTAAQAFCKIPCKDTYHNTVNPGRRARAIRWQK